MIMEEDNNNIIDKICNIDIMYKISMLINIKDFIRFAIVAKLLNKIPKESDFWFRYIKYILKDIDIDTVLLRLGYSISVINSLSPEKIDCFDILARLHKYRKCNRSGCFKLFQEINNDALSCRYHNGRVKGLSGLSCCKSKTFNSSIGCKISFHDGSFFDTVYSLREELPVIVGNQNQSSKNEHKINNNMNEIELKLPKIVLLK